VRASTDTEALIMFYATYIEQVGSYHVTQWAVATGSGYCRIVQWCADEDDARTVARELNDKAELPCAQPRG
jgi:hypothetical protein